MTAAFRQSTGCASALALVLLVSACGDDRGDRVTSYLTEANAVQRRAAPELARANKVYARYTSSQAGLESAGDDLARAERTILSTRRALERLRPPVEARRLHRLILDYYDRGAGLARETTLLGRYLPAAGKALAPLAALNRRFRRHLLAATTPRSQSAALTGYEKGLRRVLRRVRTLEPPPILRPAHRAQLAQLTSARRLAGGLERAIRERDAKAVRQLLRRFRRLVASSSVPALGRRAVRAYNRRYDDLTRAAASVEREWRRLGGALG